MITDTVNLREVRRSFRMDEGLSVRASNLLYETLTTWQLLDVLMPVTSVMNELVHWINGHGASEEVRCSITWDQNLLFIELHDRGGLVPEPHISRTDADLAVQLLAPPAVEWGAELDSRGRQLWVAFSVPGYAAVAGRTGEDGGL